MQERLHANGFLSAYHFTQAMCSRVAVAPWLLSRDHCIIRMTSPPTIHTMRTPRSRPLPTECRTQQGSLSSP